MKYAVDDLILLNRAGIGYVRLKKLIDIFGEPKRIINAGRDLLITVEGIGPEMALRISALRDGNGIKEERDLIKKYNVSVLSLSDEDYPVSLRNIYDPPLVLYVKGRLTDQDRTAVALVGSRRASTYGINICHSLSGSLAGLGITVVSGLARGIDSAAHRGALLAGGRTVAVLGSGLGHIYPPENRKLAVEISEAGAVVSEFPMNTPPVPRNFPIRNRIISGLSLGTVVVEAARKSGALITARCALEQGREVFAVPGKAGSSTAGGTHQLIRQGAKLVENANDIIEELNLDIVPFGRISVSSGKKGSALRGPKKKIYDMLSDEPVHIDGIMEECRMSAPETSRLLLELEINKMIKELPGKNFIVTA